MENIETANGKLNGKWITLLKGVLLIVIGIWMLRMPRESFESFNFIIGLIITIGGISEMALSLYYRKSLSGYGWHLTSGILDVVLGIFIIANPNAILFLITLLISFWLILRGVLAIRNAFLLKSGGSKRWLWLLIFGIVLILFAIVLIWHPEVIGFTIVFWMAVSFIILGVLRVIVSFKLNE